jgi:hypothetical protein
MVDGRLRCAAVSVRRGEPLFATASRVRRWLVVEQPGPWGHRALLESRLDERVALSLQSHGKRHGVRVVLARRTGVRTAAERRRVHLAHTAPDGGWIERLDLDLDELARLDLSVLRSATRPGLGEPGPAALTLVCTNGKHDPCCADLGRPVARELKQAGLPDVWECSHIGGDRFAANVVSLPSGVYLGRVPPERAADIVRDLSAGSIDLEHYRGRSCYPTIVQAAELAARRELAEQRVDAVTLAESTLDDDDLHATFDHASGAVDVRVRRRRAERAPLTCAGGTGRPWTYELVDVRRR